MKNRESHVHHFIELFS